MPKKQFDIYSTAYIEQRQRLHESNMKSLCADLKIARLENNKMAERIGELEDVVDMQTQRVEIAEKHLSTVKSKSKVLLCAAVMMRES